MVAFLGRATARSGRRARRALTWRTPRAPREPVAATPPPALPVTLAVRPEVFRAIAASVATAGSHETAGPLLGTVERSWDGGEGRLIVAVLATVPAGPRVHAGPASVALGRSGDGERAATALHWWRGVTGLDLRHLGDWHKHPSGCPEPSAGDRATAAEMRVSSAAPVWLTAVAVTEPCRDDTKASADGHLVRFERDWSASGDVRFYREAGPPGLVAVPVRVESDLLPRLPALPWHVTDPARFAAECRLLRAAGFRVAVAPEGEGRPGLRLRVERPGDAPLVVVTGPCYPREAPVVLDERDRPLPAQPWAADRFLVDLLPEPA